MPAVVLPTPQIMQSPRQNIIQIYNLLIKKALIGSHDRAWGEGRGAGWWHVKNPDRAMPSIGASEHDPCLLHCPTPRGEKAGCGDVTFLFSGAVQRHPLYSTASRSDPLARRSLTRAKMSTSYPVIAIDDSHILCSQAQAWPSSDVQHSQLSPA